MGKKTVHEGNLCVLLGNGTVLLPTAEPSISHAYECGVYVCACMPWWMHMTICGSALVSCSWSLGSPFIGVVFTCWLCFVDHTQLWSCGKQNKSFFWVIPVHPFFQASMVTPPGLQEPIKDHWIWAKPKQAARKQKSKHALLADNYP